ncbi:MAG: lamin tail domain-containing protein [Balneolaceae bacterium]
MYIFGFFLVQASMAYSQQLIIDEDFEDQDLTENPEWTGDQGHFTFFDNAGNTQLQLNAPGAGTTQIQTLSNAAYGSWEFFIDQDFPPSDGNRAFIFLISDREDLSGDVNGYAIQTGENGSDDIFRLFRFEEGSATEEVLTGTLDISTGGPFRIRIIRDEDGTWQYYESAGYSSEPVLAGSALDNTFTLSGYFGMLLQYTSTRSENFFFDDIRFGSFSAIKTELFSPSVLDIHFNYPVDENSLSPADFFINGGIGIPQSADLLSDFTVRLTYAQPFPDGEHTVTINDVEHIFGGEIEAHSQLNFSVENLFEINEVRSVSNNKIEIQFTEEVDEIFALSEKFILSEIGFPDEVSQPQPGSIELTFNAPIPAGDYELSISEIQSINGWPLAGNDQFSLFIYDDYQDGDLLISEFFYRTPVEWRTDEFDRPRYIEIYNTSGRILNLRNWTLNDENLSPGADISIFPDEYLVMANGESIFRNKFGNRNFAEAENFPPFSLTTDNKIVLKNNLGAIADSLHYDAGLWGGNGVALERYSTDIPAALPDNWAESEDALLGSPGLSNTLQKPSEAPVAEHIEVLVPGKIRVTFSAAISDASLDDLSNFRMNREVKLTNAEFFPDERVLELETPEKLADGQTYTFTYRNVEDIFGNGFSGDREFEFRFVNPFSILSAEAENGNHLVVRFTQPLNIPTISPTDFYLPVDTAPLNLVILNSEEVRLEFPDPFTPGKHSLLVKNVDSMSGWTIEENSPFEFYLFEKAEPGDILINEFMYNPPDVYAEYVELVNHSDKLLNLKNWELRRQDGGSPNGGVFSETNLPLEAGEFLVITPDSIPLHNTFGVRPWVQMSSFPAFTVQSEGAIRLINDSGTVIDSLQYNPSEWGGNEIALERKSANVSSVYVENWGESPNELLGTPGLENNILADTDPPELIDFFITQNQSFILTFNERLNMDSAADSENYTIKPSIPVSLVMAENNRVTLLHSEELADDQTYVITVDEVEDLFGNVAESESANFHFLKFREAEPQQLVINEILYRRLEAGSPEFVEIYNHSEENISLAGWTLWDESGSTEIPENIIIRPGEYLVFTDTGSFASENEQVVHLQAFPSLNNNGDAVVLKNSNETVIDSVFYRPEWGDHVPGISLERKDPSALSADPANWAAATAEDGSTPAAENSRFEPDAIPPEILFANLFHPDSLEVVFSEFISLDSGASSQEANQQKQSGQREMLQKTGESLHQNTTTQNNPQFLLNGTAAEVLVYDPLAGNRVVIDASASEPGTEITLRVESMWDFQGNINLNQNLPVAQPLAEGDVVINEIMYQPLADNHDNLPDQSDYIELYNRQTYALSLEGIFLHDEPDENNLVSRMEPVSTASKWIPANGYVLLYPETHASALEETELAEFFGLEAEHSPFSIRFDRSSLSLPQAGRGIYLADSTGSILDMADYRPEWHNPNINDTRGISLERIHPEMETNDASNWGSSTAAAGGTPGAVNSLYQNMGQPPGGTGISFEPNPFSPDDDGYDDNLFIHYSLNEPDYLIRIRIFDRYGRLVRKLTEGTPAGFQGSEIWDGRTDNGGRNRIGIYIIYAEAYNSAAGKNLSFKETVVLARQF